MIGAYIPDLINLVGALISVIGFLYVTYDLLKRERLQLLTRLLAPALIGGVILVIFGALDYSLFVGTNSVIQGVILYGLVGVMIGLFNGSFVRWAPWENKSALKGFLERVQKWRRVSKGDVEPSDLRSQYSKKKRAEENNKQPPFFSWGDALIGLFIAFPVWLAVDFLFGLPFVQGLIFGICLALVGGIFAGFWRFINWERPSPGESHSLSLSGGLIGFYAALILGFIVLFIPSDTPVPALIAVLSLALSGTLAGLLWRYSGLPGILKGLKGKFQTFFKKAPAPANIAATAPISPIPKDAVSMPKVPLFSLRGCLIGLIAAFFFGFASALLANELTCFSCSDSVSGALTSASFIGLAGAVTGGVSRYIFDWADHLKEGQLLLIGGFTTLLGFALQVLPPLLHLFGISGQ